jgi:hypothetical protein
VDPVPNHKHVIALLGRRDEPADGVQDYCECLARAMATQDGWALEIVRVPWPQQGWRAALQWLLRESESWRGRWVLVQYTALSWSRRGFPLGLLYVLWILRRSGTRCVMIFHDTAAVTARTYTWEQNARQMHELFRRVIIQKRIRSQENKNRGPA